ncbi:MAG: hypothetical protein AAF514_21995, partial [Verrucomicrobiota bacterium]
WPVHETDSPSTRTSNDQRLTELATLPTKDESFSYYRSDSHDPFTEFYTGGNRNNLKLFNYLMGQTYETIPGYRSSLATKYGSTRPGPYKPGFFKEPTEQYLDHFQIGLMILDYIRNVNLIDDLVEQPYAGLDDSSYGQTSGLSLIDPDLETGTGLQEHRENWARPSVEPLAPGRRYTISEVALVFVHTASVEVIRYEDGRFNFRQVNGGTGDGRVVERVLGNHHPRYADWLGRPFGQEDVGKTFAYIEVGMIPEIFAVTKGFHPIHPGLSIRLLVDGPSYRGGLDEETGLKVNNVPINLWGKSVASAQQTGPVVSTVDSHGNTFRGNLPTSWDPTGGHGGIRILRFGRFVIDDTDRGWYGAQFLSNGTGPLRALYCQTALIVDANKKMRLEQDEPLQLVLYHGKESAANTERTQQMFHLRFADPGEEIVFAPPNLSRSDYAGWTRRFNRAAFSNPPITLLSPHEETDSVKGLTVSHGDYRHITTKRMVPSELFRNHPLTEKALVAHSLSWSDDTSASPGSTFSHDLNGRGMVGPAVVATSKQSDFTFDPAQRKVFAPLLATEYIFPIDPSITRDFDNAPGNQPDGAYINKADDGADFPKGSSIFNQKYPYFKADTDRDFVYTPQDPQLFNPRRMVPSPVIMGSLPSAV